MTTSNLNVRIDNNLREQAIQVLSNYGLSPTQAIKLFLNQIVKTGSVPLSFDYDRNSYVTNRITMNAIKDAREGNLFSCENFDEFLQEIRK